MKIPLILLLMVFTVKNDFKEKQLQYPRVKEAYASKQSFLEDLILQNHLKTDQLQLFLQAFKQEGMLEVWAKNKSDRTFRLVKQYEICRSSGVLGPKRREGDLQVPEGFYHISDFNPQSNYYLSLGISYPNSSDKVFADKEHPGGAIYIHGNCVTIGCLPITDDKIKELYILAVEACQHGQSQIPVTIYPFRMSKENLQNNTRGADYSTETLNLWADLKKGYDKFQQDHILPQVTYLPSGRHQIK